MTNYARSEDGLFIAVKPDVWGIDNPVGQVFAARNADWRENAIPVWPQSFYRNGERMHLRDQDWGEGGGMLPLTRALLLDYLRSRGTEAAPDTHATDEGDLMVPFRTDSAALVNGTVYVCQVRRTSAALLTADWATNGTRGWNYGTWRRIVPSETEALAAFAVQWWRDNPDGGLAYLDPAHVSAPPEGAVVVPSAEGSLLTVTARGERPDPSVEPLVEEQVVDGMLVRTLRIPMVPFEETVQYAEEAWVREVANRYANSHGQVHNLESLLSGDRMPSGKRWPDLPRVSYDGRVYLSITDLTALKDEARGRYSWCSVADTVIRESLRGRHHPDWRVYLSRVLPVNREPDVPGIVPGTINVDARRYGMSVEVSAANEEQAREVGVRVAQAATGWEDGWEVTDAYRR